jgi:hypothetical protein
MIQLAYLSSTPALLSADDIAQILLTSRENNGRRGITGILLYKDGNVLQVLEGDEENVHRLFDTIKQDVRHRGVICMYEKVIECRDFPEWTMAFHDLNAEGARYLAGYSDLMAPDFDLSTLKSSDALKLIRVFKARPS